MENLCYSVHNSVSYVTVLLLEKTIRLGCKGFDNYVRKYCALNRELQVRGVVDRHKCCHGSCVLAVGARKRHSKYYKSSRFKLNEKIDDRIKESENTLLAVYFDSRLIQKRYFYTW